MLEDYARRNGLPNPTHFTDDGVSGTRFDRPGFLAMMEEVEAGRVEAIVIKDMSRLGRDYLKVGQVMEILRQRGVRLIAINDGVDSLKGDDDFTPFRNIMNEFYARDTSRKIRSVFKSKGMSGKHLTGTVIYGYLWDEKREHWLVDEEAAEVVRRIFALTLEGYGPYQIACKLSADRIEIPVVHLARFNEGVNRSKPVKDPYGWGSSTIVNILKKREYLGHTINFKTRKHFKDKKSHYVSEDEWTIFENTHEAIIDQQTFDLVQKIRSNVRRYPNGWGEAAPLTGLLYCADCGGKMYVHRTNNGRRISQYTCSNYTKVPCGTLCPTQHRINESAVLTLVSDTLRAIAEYSRNDRTEFIHTVQETQVAQQSADISKKRRRLAAAQKRAGELEKLICKIYEDNALGKLPDARYRALDAQYAKEQDALEIEIAEIQPEIEVAHRSAEEIQNILRGKRVLLVEDHPLDVEISRRILEHVAVNVISAQDGKAALEQFKAEEPYHFDAILMDIQMPNMNGFVAARAIRKVAKPDAQIIPIIALSADDTLEDVGKCKEAGMNAHIAKPVEPQKLYQILCEYLLAPI